MQTDGYVGRMYGIVQAAPHAVREASLELGSLADAVSTYRVASIEFGPGCLAHLVIDDQVGGDRWGVFATTELRAEDLERLAARISGARLMT